MATLGSLFGGLAGGLQAGAQLGLHQQQLGLQQQYQQQQLGLAQQNAQRLHDIAQRQSALQFYSAFVNTLQLEPNERGPALEKLQETAQGTGVAVDPALFEHARKLTADQAKATANLIGQFVPNASTEDLVNLPKNYLGTVLPLLIQGRYRETLQQSLGNLGQPGAPPQGPPPAPGSTISPSPLPQGFPQGPAQPVQAAPLSELDQLKATFALNERKLSLLSQYGTVVPEAKEMATILNDQQNRIQQRLTQLQAGPLMTPERLIGILQRALVQERPDLKPGTPAYQVALDQAYANYSKIVPVQAGGEAFGGLGLVVPRAGAGTPAGVPGGGPMPLVSRPARPEAAEVSAVAQSEAILKQLGDLIQKAQTLPGLQGTVGRGSLFTRKLGEEGLGISTLSPEERDYLSQFQLTRIAFDRALTAGSSVFRSPTIVNLLAQAFSSPTGPGVVDRLTSVQRLAQDELTSFKRTLEQSGRQPIGQGPSLRQPASVSPAAPNAQAEAEAFLKKFRK